VLRRNVIYSWYLSWKY